MLCALALLCSVARVNAHGALVYPLSRNSVDANEVGCDAHTDVCTTTAKGVGCVNFTHPGEALVGFVHRRLIWELQANPATSARRPFGTAKVGTKS